jgi:hypothetical protein
MKTKVIRGTEVHLSSGNVFADLELPDAEKLKVEFDLFMKLKKQKSAEADTPPLNPLFRL